MTAGPFTSGGAPMLMSPGEIRWNNGPPGNGPPKSPREKRVKSQQKTRSHRHRRVEKSATSLPQAGWWSNFTRWLNFGGLYTERRAPHGSRESLLDDTVPLFIKGLGCVSGVILIGAALYSLWPIQEKIVNIPIFFIKIYLIVFGIAVVVVEGKNFLPPHNRIREWFYEEFHFLSHPRGKCFMYLFVMLLCLAFWELNYIFLLSGVLFFVLSLINIVASFMPPEKLRTAGVSAKDFRTTTKLPHFGLSSSELHNYHHKNIAARQSGGRRPPPGRSASPGGDPRRYTVSRPQDNMWDSTDGSYSTDIEEGEDDMMMMDHHHHSPPHRDSNMYEYSQPYRNSNVVVSPYSIPIQRGSTTTTTDQLETGLPSTRTFNEANYLQREESFSTPPLSRLIVGPQQQDYHLPPPSGLHHLEADHHHQGMYYPQHQHMAVDDGNSTVSDINATKGFTYNYFNQHNTLGGYSRIPDHDDSCE